MVVCSDLKPEPENGKTHHDENIRLHRKLLAEEEQRPPERKQG